MTENSSPIFIIGVHRSGTTLLRFILSSHSRIYIPPETDFIPYFFRKHPHRELTDQQISRILNIIFTRYRFVEEWQGNPPDTQTLLKLMPTRTPASFLDALYGLYARQNGAIRWGDKTPIYASYVDLIHHIFPSAQFIHIVRNPFDSAISLLDKYEKQEFHIDVYFAARNWVRRINQILNSKNHLDPNLYYELKYEDLVHDPETMVHGVCDFLGETFEPNMLEHHQLAQDRITADSHFFSNVRKPISTRSVGRGRKELHLADRRLIQHITESQMVAFGYPKDDLGSMTSLEKIRMAFLQVKYEVLQAGRRLATEMGLLPPI